LRLQRILELQRLVSVVDQRALDLAMIDERDHFGGADLLVRTPRIRVAEHKKQQRCNRDQQSGARKKRLNFIYDRPPRLRTVPS
jgi:hypothetical protein